MKTCANILNNLFEYTSLLKSIKSIAFNSENQKDNSDVILIDTVAIAYDTVKLELHRKEQRDNNVLYFRCEFQIEDGHGHYQDSYCVNKEVENDLIALIHNTVLGSGFEWDDNNTKGNFSSEVVNYL